MPRSPFPRHGLARVLSKWGIASRTDAARWIAAGRVTVNGRVQTDPEYPILQGRHIIAVDGHRAEPRARIHLMLNKPRGLITTACDERGRETVYRCFEGAGLPPLMPVGRLDKASEGLLLFSNDPEWSACITDPETGPGKTYHVQIDCLPDDSLIERLTAGIDSDGEHLSARCAAILRIGERNAWLEIVLDEGRNRQIRRLLAAQGIGVLRLVRVAIGSLLLGDLAKGTWRPLTAEEIKRLVVRDP